MTIEYTNRNIMINIAILKPHFVHLQIYFVATIHPNEVIKPHIVAMTELPVPQSTPTVHPHKTRSLCGNFYKSQLQFPYKLMNWFLLCFTNFVYIEWV